MQTAHKYLPPAWVDRLFARFAAAFGSMKVGTMYPVDQADEVHALWGQQLSRFAPESIGLALQAVIDSGREWPPTLPEFVEQCRLCAVGRTTHAPANALTRPKLSPEVVAANLRRVNEALESVTAGGKPSRVWAHRILSRVAAGESVSPAVYEMAKKAIGAVAQREPGCDDE